MPNTKPRAFVIMPFGEGFDEIYNLFTVGALTEAGYDVFRGDDIRSHQNILKDILEGLANSDLVVADLSGSNPNVYYELGLAHGLGRRVVLLTQKVEELPFDLRSYRVIPYSTHFAEIAKARDQLVSLARDAAEGRVPFGSPVSDFLAASGVVRQPLLNNESVPVSLTEGEAGVLDHLVDVEEGIAKLAAILTALNSETASIGGVTADVGERLKALAASGSPARARRGLVIAYAERLSAYAQSLAALNDRYAETLTTTRTGLEFVIRAQKPSTAEETQQLGAFLAVLDQAEPGAREARAAISQLAEIIRAVPRVERTFNQAADLTVRQTERYEQNLDQTISMFVRARELVQSRLDNRSS
jgi:hypothetical protein